MTSVKPIREKDRINRRTFFTKSVGWSTGLTLLAFPGIIKGVLAAKVDKSKEEIFKELEKKVEEFMPKKQDSGTGKLNIRYLTFSF